MNKRWLWGLFAGLCLLQWGVPLALVQRAQLTLEQGTVYRFETAPVDPEDPFRGRYVALDFQAAEIAVPAGWSQAAGRRLWAPIIMGDQGYARLGVPQEEPPTTGDYLQVRVQWFDGAGSVRVALPFDRYYLEEQRAPQVEQQYRERNSRAPADADDPRRPAYATVRVRKGYALIEDLIIDGRSVATQSPAEATAAP